MQKFVRFHETLSEVMAPRHHDELHLILLDLSPPAQLNMWRSDPGSRYGIILTLSVSITNAFMVVYPQLCILMGESRTRRRTGGNLCGVVMSNFWTNSNAALSKLISLLASGANDWGRSVGSPAS